MMVSPGANANGSNDTIICAVNYCDSSEATNSNAGASQRDRYNYSFDGGATWQEILGIDITQGQKSRFPDMYFTTIGGLRTVLAAGRFWTPNPSTTQIGGASYDAGLGVGSPTTTLITGLYHAGRDYFGGIRPDGKIAGLIQAGEGSTTFADDTLRYITFDPVTNTFSAPVTVYTDALSNQVCSSTMRACPVASSNLLVGAFNFVNEPSSGGNGYRSLRISVSTNNGTSWTVKEYGYTTPYVIAGDSCQAYWHEEIAFKPGTTNYYAVYPTWPYIPGGLHEPTNPQGWKICIQSPVLNGEKPVVIADYRNMNILSDTSKFNRLDYTLQHSNGSYLGHPTLGFSEDGTVMWCAFEAIQADTCPGPPTYNFRTFYHDIYVTKSLDGGNTWATPWNVTKTPQYDEMYPVISWNHNKNDYPYLMFQCDKIPGCHSFLGNQPAQQTVDLVYAGFLSTIIGVRKISENVPGTYSLSQNYPNPFNPTTNIRFAISKTANVTLKVYNIMGQLVSTLLSNEKMTPGTREISFDGTNLASGVYFYTIKADNFIDTKKMVLVK
jgi:GAF domain-containing protein